jgi:hypothetical protein
MIAAAKQRIFFQRCFEVNVSNGWINAFQLRLRSIPEGGGVNGAGKTKIPQQNV